MADADLLLASARVLKNGGVGLNPFVQAGEDFEKEAASPEYAPKVGTFHQR